ncbi:MAG: response regulator [Xanthomonadales bacterium]|nr:response regulator [Xanthomonadales bacterium]
MNRLLIVDDDEDTLLIVQEIARLAGFEPLSASCFTEARDALRQGVSAVLLDIVMPDQLCIRLGAYMAEECPGVPVILMSAGNRDFIDKTRAQLEMIGLTVAGALSKPFWVDGLLESLSRALSKPPDASATEPEALLD